MKEESQRENPHRKPTKTDLRVGRNIVYKIMFFCITLTMAFIAIAMLQLEHEKFEF